MIRAKISYDLCQTDSHYPMELQFKLVSDSMALLRYFDESCEVSHKEYANNSIVITCEFNSQIYRLKDLALHLCSFNEEELAGGIYGTKVVYNSHFADVEKASR